MFGVLLEAFGAEQFAANGPFRFGEQAHSWDRRSHPYQQGDLHLTLSRGNERGPIRWRTGSDFKIYSEEIERGRNPARGTSLDSSLAAPPGRARRPDRLFPGARRPDPRLGGRLGDAARFCGQRPQGRADRASHVHEKALL